MSEKSRPEITIFNKMIALSSIRKPPPVAAMVELSRLVYFVGLVIITTLNYDYFLILKTKLFVYGLYVSLNAI